MAIDDNAVAGRLMAHKPALIALIESHPDKELLRVYMDASIRLLPDILGGTIFPDEAIEAAKKELADLDKAAQHPPLPKQ